MTQTVLSSNQHNFLSIPQEVLSGEDWAAAGTVTIRAEFAVPTSEFVPSWTGQTNGDDTITIEVKPGWGDEPWFDLGTWGLNARRTSKNGQSNDFGAVSTDILKTKNATRQVEIRISASGSKNLNSTQLDSLTLSGLPAKEFSAHRWEAVPALDVPLRAQMNYEGGNVLCSPTSVSMILSYWAKKLDRKILDLDVPVVQQGVYDPAWGGTGNWPFNVAFAGSQPGMTGFVSRFRHTGDLEEWLDTGVPVACSVSYSLLKGRDAASENDGHLVVLVGIDASGNPIFNDPGTGVVRKTYEREAFERAWQHSKNTVYIIHPKYWVTPNDGPWPSETNTESDS